MEYDVLVQHVDEDAKIKTNLSITLKEINVVGLFYRLLYKFKKLNKLMFLLRSFETSNMKTCIELSVCWSISRKRW